MAPPRSWTLVFRIMSQYLQIWSGSVKPQRPALEPVASKSGPMRLCPRRFYDMLLAHRIRLDPTPAQRDYFARAAGTARRVWNWALAEWRRQVAAGQRPNAMALKYGELGLGERSWKCARCGAQHDRDLNAAINLQRLATGALPAQSALPVASPAATPGTAADIGSVAAGKVTPVRYEYGQQDGSGQEGNRAQL